MSCYATARNLLAKTAAELRTLRALGLDLLYIGPESGDDETLRRIAKGGTAADHIAAAERARAADIELSVIFLLGAGGVERSEEHAQGSARLVTAMDPRFVSALTLTVLPDTPLARAEQKGLFELPDAAAILRELRILIAESAPTNAVFRSNHASNRLPIGGRLPRDRDALVATVDAALAGRVPLVPDWQRGL